MVRTVLFCVIVCSVVTLSQAVTSSSDRESVGSVEANDWKQRAKERMARYNYTNTRPLIGILTQPCTFCPGRSYIPAAYPKWIEAAGGRAVPVRYYETDMRAVFESINGLIFPGGLTWLWLDSPYVIAARKLYDMAVEANGKGDFFPIHGTCLGHQLLHILASNVSRNELLVETDSVANPNLLNLTEAGKNSMYFGGMQADLIQKLGSPEFNIAYENHEYGLPPAHYEKWPVLKEMYSVLSTTKDRNGLEYISTVEGKKYPFFGTQWHPEKAPYEFSDRLIVHTRDSVGVSNHMASAFVDIARLSSHVVANDLELNMTIYNYAPVYTARDDTFEESYDGPDLTYFFDPKQEPQEQLTAQQLQFINQVENKLQKRESCRRNPTQTA